MVVDKQVEKGGALVVTCRTPLPLNADPSSAISFEVWHDLFGVLQDILRTPTETALW